jgi:hypothetical protein
MRHVTDGGLRRLHDEPLAVPDTDRQHLDTCGRCRAGSGTIAENAALASRLLAAPPPVTDADVAWARLQRRLADPVLGRQPAISIPRHPGRRMVNVSVGTGTIVTVGLVAGGVAAAATLTTVFAPAKVTPVPVNRSDIRAIANVLDVSTAGRSGGGLLPNSGSKTLPFGTLRWSSAGQARQVPSVAAARALTHLAFTPPATLPDGVGRAGAVVVQPVAKATISFSRDAGHGVGGTTLAITGGPAMLVQYGSRSPGAHMTTLGILTMRRPVATSTGATTSQLDAFLLSRPGVPASLARQVRLLGNLSTVLPVPVPAGADSQHVTIGGAPGVLITDGSGAAAAVIWESHDGNIHAVAGLLDGRDALNVARQVG